MLSSAEKNKIYAQMKAEKLARKAQNVPCETMKQFECGEYDRLALKYCFKEVAD